MQLIIPSYTPEEVEFVCQTIAEVCPAGAFKVTVYHCVIVEISCLVFNDWSRQHKVNLKSGEEFMMPPFLFFALYPS